MDIYLLRHGDYLQHDQLQGLSPKGESQISVVANLLSKFGITFDAILSSPKKRALETAYIMAKKIGFPLEEITQTESLNPSASPDEAVNFIQNFSDKESILIAGHLPCINEIARYLLAKNSQLIIRFDQGTICRLQVESFKSHSSELIWVMPNNVCSLIQPL